MGFCLALAAGSLACTDETTEPMPFDTGASDLGQRDAGEDAGPPPDVGPVDLGAAEDAGSRPDGGSRDAGQISQGQLEVRVDGLAVPSGSTLEFGRIVVDSPGATFGVEIVNVGSGVLQVESPTWSGSAAEDFQVAPAQPLALVPTSSRAYAVTFQPTVSSTRTAELVLRSDDPGAPSFVMTLLGFGVALEDLPSDTNGDWSAPTFTAYDTRESRIVVRIGDIDNLGFGWPNRFDPFSGQSTPPHPFPWTPDPADPTGTDRIMVVSSYVGAPPAGRDGYTTTTSRPQNLPAPVTLSFDLRGSRPYSAVLQMFVDDFQAPVWRARYEARLDGVRAPLLEEVLATLVQTGPIGKLITLPIPQEYLGVLDDGRLEIAIDDPTTGAGDGFAIDFVKLFIDVYGFTNVGTIEGRITDAINGQPLSNVAVTASGVVSTVSDAEGFYRLARVPAGFVYLRASQTGYAPLEALLDLRAGQTATRNIPLTPL